MRARHTTAKRGAWLGRIAWAAVACADPIETGPEPDASIAPDASAADARAADASEPDASEPADAGPEPDAEPAADVGLRVRSLNLVPVGGRAASSGFKLDGRLSPSSADPATSDRHRLRGRLVPLGP
jgi:hypothetical protein